MQTDRVYDDLDRPPLRALALRRALVPDGWRVEVLEETGSTNAVVAERARAAELAGLVVVAERQVAGRGRLDRTWLSPSRAGLTFSVLLRPAVPAERLPWVPLVGGLAVATALAERAGLEVGLKWPNDVLLDGRKVCGVLAELPVPGAVVLGIGLNVTTTAEELPAPPPGQAPPTSMALAGATTTDRDTVLRAVLRALRTGLTDLEGEPERVRAAYRERCTTLGAQVRLELPGAAAVVGQAEQVDDAGRLVVDGTAYGAGDVVHLRGA